MIATFAAGLSGRLEDQFGDQLRSVGYYDGDTNEFVYVREDVESEYESADVARVFRNVRLESLDRSHQESLYTHGALECTFRVFEEATEIHVDYDETSGVLVAVDAGEFDRLREITDLCLEVDSTEPTDDTLAEE